MSFSNTAAGEVFSAEEIARAAGVAVGAVRRLAATGETDDDRYFSPADAVRMVRLLGLGMPGAVRELFPEPVAARRSPGAGVLGSGAVHAATAAMLATLASLSVGSASPPVSSSTPARLVFVATPGPGGGGGGGGLRQAPRAPRAQLRGTSALRSPVPPPRPRASTRPAEPLKPKPVTLIPPTEPAKAEPPAPVAAPIRPDVVAPVATRSSDPRDRAGVPSERTAASDSQGSGAAGGVDTGRGSGLGEGTGAGIGAGAGGGTGGGPYRAGSGVTAPSLLQEVRPDYTDDARRAGVEGDVVLEIVVRRDGTVGEVKVLRGLRGGLDARAVDAVRQWRFAPARRHGTPVDVVVEVAVEFKLR